MSSERVGVYRAGVEVVEQAGVVSTTRTRTTVPSTFSVESCGVTSTRCQFTQKLAVRGAFVAGDLAF